jgi:hypothetical protein
LFSLTTSGASVLRSALGTLAPGNNIKLRASKIGKALRIQTTKILILQTN